MPAGKPITTNFTSGEISPLMRGRVDLVKYANGVGYLENFIVRPHGAITRRPGSDFVGEVEDRTVEHRLIPFVYSVETSYMLVFGPLTMQVVVDGEFLEDGFGARVEISTPYTEDDIKTLRFAQSGNRMYLAHPNHQPMELIREDGGTWNLTLHEHVDGPYLDENTTDNELELVDVVDSATLISHGGNAFVVGDVGKFITVAIDGFDYLAKVLTYVSATEITIDVLHNVVLGISPEVKVSFNGVNAAVADHDNTFKYTDAQKFLRLNDQLLTEAAPRWVYLTEFLDHKTMYNDNVTYPTYVPHVAVPAAAVRYQLKNRTITGTVKSRSNIFNSSDVGRHVRLAFNDEVVWCKITVYVGAAEVDVELGSDLPTSTGNLNDTTQQWVTSKYRLGAWGTNPGYPEQVVFHEDRLCWASTAAQPQTLFFSETGDFASHSPTNKQSEVQDNNAIQYTLNAATLNTITWLVSGPVLLIGTIAGEWQARSSNTVSEPLTPSNFFVTQQTTFGSTEISRPFRIGPSVLFLQRSGRAMRELFYSFEIDAYVAEDVSITSEHLFRLNASRAEQLTFQQEPYRVIWVLLTSGDLIALTYEREQKVYAWHRHNLGGDVESIAALPAGGQREDELYLIVRRQRADNGQYYRYVERISDYFEPSSSTDNVGVKFLDCAKSYSGAGTTLISGFQHLAGSTVKVIANNRILDDHVVDNFGNITLVDTATEVYAGLHNDGVVQLLPPESGVPQGFTAQGRIQRIHTMVARLLDSQGFYHGKSLDSLKEHARHLTLYNRLEWTADTTELTADSTLVTADNVPILPHYTGDTMFKTDHSHDRGTGYYIVARRQTPLTIISLMPELNTSI